MKRRNAILDTSYCNYVTDTCCISYTNHLFTVERRLRNQRDIRNNQPLISTTYFQGGAPRGAGIEDDHIPFKNRGKTRIHTGTCTPCIHTHMHHAYIITCTPHIHTHTHTTYTHMHITHTCMPHIHAHTPYIHTYIHTHSMHTHPPHTHTYPINIDTHTYPIGCLFSGRSRISHRGGMHSLEGGMDL